MDIPKVDAHVDPAACDNAALGRPVRRDTLTLFSCCCQTLEWTQQPNIVLLLGLPVCQLLQASHTETVQLLMSDKRVLIIKKIKKKYKKTVDNNDVALLVAAGNGHTS